MAVSSPLLGRYGFKNIGQDHTNAKKKWCNNEICGPAVPHKPEYSFICAQQNLAVPQFLCQWSIGKPSMIYPIHQSAVEREMFEASKIFVMWLSVSIESYRHKMLMCWIWNKQLLKQQEVVVPAVTFCWRLCRRITLTLGTAAGGWLGAWFEHLLHVCVPSRAGLQQISFAQGTAFGLWFQKPRSVNS